MTLHEQVMEEYKETLAATHPEKRDDEVFLSNGDPFEWNRSCAYRTKRYGNVAYDISGNPVDWLRPVFVKREEFITYQVNHPDAMQRIERKVDEEWAARKELLEVSE